MTRLRGRGFAAVNYPTGMNLGGDPSQALVAPGTALGTDRWTPLDVSVPNDPGLVGRAFYFQVVHVDGRRLRVDVDPIATPGWSRRPCRTSWPPSTCGLRRPARQRSRRR